MAVDISKVFKANVKAIRMNQGDSTTNVLNEQLLSKKKKEESNFIKECKNIVTNITILKEFLNENKKYYIQPNYLISQSNDLNETDWQKFEDEAERIIKKCADKIRQLKENTFKQRYAGQYRECLESIFQMLEKYLKDVCKFYSEQKAIRVRRIVEKKNYSQLCSSDLKTIEFTESSPVKPYNEDLEKEQKNKNIHIENELSQEEIQAFEKEGELMYEQFAIQTEDVKKIESQVIEVAKLTQIFAENIVSQLSTVDRIQKAALDVNSNLTTGNENIKEAMKKNAAMRLWILFIILVLSFTLLFLDWYND